MDSDEDGENDKAISLTHLLFGNIDDEGNLENDFLDPVSMFLIFSSIILLCLSYYVFELMYYSFA